jgi:catechol 2,3-dioxygenase
MEHESSVLRQAETPGLGHIAYRVSAEDELDTISQLLADRILPVKEVRSGDERGQGRAVRTQDPLGFPIEFYYEVERVPRLLQQFHQYRGAHVMRIDHVNLHVPCPVLAKLRPEVAPPLPPHAAMPVKKRIPAAP